MFGSPQLHGYLYFTVKFSVVTNPQSKMGPISQLEILCFFFFIEGGMTLLCTGRVSAVILWLGIARISLEHLICCKYLEDYLISWVINNKWQSSFLCKVEQLQILILLLKPL